MTKLSLRLFALLVVLIPTVAFAHPGHGESSGLAHALSHLFGGLNPVLAMVGIGIIAAALLGIALSDGRESCGGAD
jgi:urease accessory protein